jgi:hypothetical protein
MRRRSRELLAQAVRAMTPTDSLHPRINVLSEVKKPLSEVKT